MTQCPQTNSAIVVSLQIVVYLQIVAYLQIRHELPSIYTPYSALVFIFHCNLIKYRPTYIFSTNSIVNRPTNELINNPFKYFLKIVSNVTTVVKMSLACEVHAVSRKG